MQINPQRTQAIKLAEKFGATKVVKALRGDEYNDVRKVLNIAAEELGSDKLVDALLQGHLGWSADALRFVDDLGKRKDELIERAESAPIIEPINLADESVTNGGEIGRLELYLAGGAAMEAWFTMFWIHGSLGYPQAQTTDSGAWLWSQKLSIAINRQAVIGCADFASHIGAPLQEGDVVWMVQNSCSADHDTGFRFTYKPGGPNVRIDVVSGAATPSFSIHQGD